MAARSTRKTRTSTPRLSDLARHVVVPGGMVKSAWPQVSLVLAALGISFEAFQVGIARLILGKRADGQYAADTTVLSIPRQVGKTFMLGAIVFALCILNPRLLCIWTAHHTATSDETFADLQAMARLPRVAKHVKTVRAANGQQTIVFRNGARIKFGARERGFGRGFKKVGILVLDEAQILTESAMDNLVPTTNRAENPLILMAGTPPRPGKDPGEVFTALRDEALQSGPGESETLYVEFSADPDADVHDRKQWAKANPSFPKHTKVRAMLRMLKHLGAASFRREALGIWDARGQLDPPVISPDAWAARRVDAAPGGDQVAYGVKFSPDGARMALAVAVATDEGAFVEIIDAASTAVGIAVLAEWLSARWRSCDAIVIDGKGYAGTLNDRLLESGVRSRAILRPTWDAIVTANSSFVEGVRDGGITHAGQEWLAHSVGGSAREDRGKAGGWGFKPNAPEVDVTPLEAAVLAVAGLKTKKRGGGRNGTDRAGGGRGAVVM